MVCQVACCGKDLSQLKEYHQRYRICEVHIKLQAVSGGRGEGSTEGYMCGRERDGREGKGGRGSGKQRGVWEDGEEERCRGGKGEGRKWRKKPTLSVSMRSPSDSLLLPSSFPPSLLTGHQGEPPPALLPAVRPLTRPLGV
jgi:hypothetical protein